MDRRSGTQIFPQEKSELLLDTTSDSNDHVRWRVTLDLSYERIIAHLARIERRDVKVGCAKQINVSQPGDCLLICRFARHDPENAFLWLRSKPRDQLLEKFQTRDAFDVSS